MMITTLDRVPIESIPADWKVSVFERNSQYVKITIEALDLVERDASVDQERASGNFSPKFDNALDAVKWLDAH